MRFRITIPYQLSLAIFVLMPLNVIAQQTDTKSNTEVSDLIKSVLTDQVKSWNQGDILGFMETYWKDDRMTFSSGGETRQGWQATLDRYKSSYPKEKMGQLRFDRLHITLLSSDSAFALGEWHLDINGEKKDGNFTLVLRKLNGAWKIVHDHSSVFEPKKDN
jgi:ketosteroid isomerase-like protein